MWTVPFTLPQASPNVTVLAGSTNIVNTGGYDVMIGGLGFRLATDKNDPYIRTTDPVTVRKYDSSLEPGEQSLSPLPWLKDQSSWHAGAGQLNLEQGYTAFQYQNEQIEHIRFFESIGIDPWTPGIVQRLPDCSHATYGADLQHFVTGNTGGVDCAIAGGVHSLQSITWPSGPNGTPTASAIDLSPAIYGGASNVTVESIVTDGANYYALLQLAADGSAAGVRTYVVQGALGSTAAPSAWYKGPATSTQVHGVLGWVKSRLVGGLANGLYELPTVGSTTALPTAKYTHPSPQWTWTAFCDSPEAILGAGVLGWQSSVLAFTLDTTGSVPTLAGGADVGSLPNGEVIYDLENVGNTFVALATTRGVRIGTFDTNSGYLSAGPLSLTTDNPVTRLASRDRFVYAAYTNGHLDGSSGLARLDLSLQVDSGGRYAWASDLRPPTTATTRTGTITGVGILPESNRLIYTTSSALLVEGDGPGSDGDAYMTTSRIRYSTAELKLFKRGLINGTLSDSQIKVEGVTPTGGVSSLATLGPVATGQPGEFSLPGGQHEWLQLRFHLIGADCQLTGYVVKAYPTPARQTVITFTVNCYREERDKFGASIIEVDDPRTRQQKLMGLMNDGDEVAFVEFTNTVPVLTPVVIDNLQYTGTAAPNIQDDFGGTITIKLRATSGV